MKAKLTDDVLIGIDRALSQFESRLTAQCVTTDLESVPSIADLVGPLRAAQAWLMSVQSEIQANATETN